MRVIQIITKGHEIYGAQKHVLDLSTSFIEDGHEVKVVVGSVGALSDELQRRNIPWVQSPSLQREINPIRDFRACKELKKIIAEFNPDVVASHSSKAGIVSRWVCWKLGIPNTFTAHGWSFEDGIPFVKRNIYKAIEKAIGKISCKIITVSNLGKELALKHSIVPEEKLEMIYYGTPDRSLNYPPNPQSVFTMSMVAGFREQKDHDTLIRALGQLKNEPWQIFLLGDGPLQTECEQLVEELQISDKVHFKGMVDNVPDYLAMTDVLVLITKWEGLPISTIEGLSFALPVISSDVSGVREQVINNFNGLLVERGNVSQVRDAVRDLMNSPEKRSEFSESSRRLYDQHFTNRAMYEKTKRLYESLIH